jgi:hypothetical protein
MTKLPLEKSLFFFWISLYEEFILTYKAVAVIGEVAMHFVTIDAIFATKRG